MTTYFFRFATTAALVIAQIAPTLAQPVPPTAPSQGGPQVLPARLDVPQIFPTPWQRWSANPAAATRRSDTCQAACPSSAAHAARYRRAANSSAFLTGSNFVGVVRCESFNNR